QAENPGFNPEHVLTARVELPGRKYDTPVKQIAFFQTVLDRMRRVPGVRSASAITWLPLGGAGSGNNFFVEGRPQPRPGEDLGADIRGIDPGYFKAMEIPLLRGEVFTDRDGPDVRKAVVINATMARTVFAGQNPIGQHILMPWGDTLRGEIVAVVGDT